MPQTVRLRRLGTVLVVAILGLTPTLTPAADRTREAGAGRPARQSDPAARDWIQLFNGRDLADWTIKFATHDLGENVRNTFRVEDGLLKVRYDQWTSFNGEFGHIFYKDPFSYST